MTRRRGRLRKDLNWPSVGSSRGPFEFGQRVDDTLDYGERPTAMRFDLSV